MRPARLRGHSSRRRAPSVLLLCLASLLPARPGASQVLQLQSGSSSLFDAHGGSATLRGGTYSVTFGAGLLGDDLALGLTVRKTVGAARFILGDEAVDFQLPTDIAGGSRYLPVRGAGLEWTRGSSAMRAHLGTTSETLGAPFFRGANSGRPLALLFWDRPVGARARLFSRTALSRRQTSIHGFALQPTTTLTTALGAGVGNDRPYLASSATLQTARLRASAAYISQRAGFRRIETDSPMAAEAVGANATLSARATRWWTFTAVRQTLLDDEDAMRRVTVSQVGSSLNLAEFRVIGAVYDSRQRQGRNIGTSLSVGRRIGRPVDVVVDYIRSDPSDDRPTESVVLRVQQVLGPRLSLIESVTRSGGQTSFNVGGELLTNPVRASVSYQTVYAPLKPGNPFVQAMGVDLRLHLLERVDLQAGTYVTPSGRMRYTVSGSYLYSALTGSAARSQPPAFPRFVVRGRVRDDEGRPVAGAVIHLGEHVVIADEQGCFFLRTERGGRLPVVVAADEFLTASRFETVSAPPSATAGPEDQAEEILITVRRR